MNDEMKSLLAAIFLSALVVLGVNHFLPSQPLEKPQEQEVAQNSEDDTVQKTVEDKSTEVAFASVAETLRQDERLPLKNEVINGSIRLKGARFDNIVLKDHR